MTSYFIPPDVEDRIEWLIKRGRRHEAFALVAIEWINPGTLDYYIAEYMARVEGVMIEIGNILRPFADALISSMTAAMDGIIMSDPDND